MVHRKGYDCRGEWFLFSDGGSTPPISTSLRSASFGWHSQASHSQASSKRSASPSSLFELRRTNNSNTMFYVYIIQSEKDSKQFYTGFTENLTKRLKEHNNGKSIHTNKFKPWKLIFYSAFNDKKRALDFEKYLKTASGIAFRNKRLI